MSNDWIDVKDKLPKCLKVVQVKEFGNCNGERLSIAQYYDESPLFLHFYGIKPCYWWDLGKREYIHSVTHWKEIE